MEEQITTPQPTSEIPENSPPPPSSPNKKKLLTIIGVILLLVLGVVGGWYFGRFSVSFGNTQIPSPTVSDQKLAADDGIEGWVFYESKLNGLTFKYPSNYSIEDRENYISLLSPLNPSPKKGFSLLEDELKIEIVISESKPNDRLESWIEEEKSKSEGEIVEKGRSTIDGVEAALLEATGMGTAEVRLVLHNNKRFMVMKYPLKTIREEEFTQILSTFEFVE